MPFQLAYFKSRNMSNVLHHFLDKHSVDVIHTQHLRMSQYTSDLSNQRRILDLPDAYSLYWQRRNEVDRPWWNQLFDSLESKRVIEAEKVVFDYDLNLVCSVEDRDHLLQIHPGFARRIVKKRRGFGNVYLRRPRLFTMRNVTFYWQHGLRPQCRRCYLFCRKYVP